MARGLSLETRFGGRPRLSPIPADTPVSDRANWHGTYTVARGDDVQTPDVEDLIRRAADGDRRAWDALVDDYTDLLWSVARGFRLDTADAADAVQTTWLRLLENLDKINQPERIAGWLATTVRRECLKMLRRRGREQPHSHEHADLDIPDSGEPVDARMLLAERDSALWSVFTKMSERCQTLLRVMMANPAPSYDAVAAALRMPIGSIGPTRSRCLSKLRTLLDEDGRLSAIDGGRT